MSPRTHQPSCLLDRRTPSLGMQPFLVIFLVSIVMTLHGCVDGVIQPLRCTHASKCRWVHYLGMLPSCPTLVLCICTFCLPYMCILASVNVHIQKPKCTYTEALFRKCPFLSSVNAHIRKKNAHIWKRASVYVHFGFCICTFTEVKMCIYGRQNAHIRKRASVYPHFDLRKCTYTEESFCIYAFWLP
jgi:hypothetical protein